MIKILTPSIIVAVLAGLYIIYSLWDDFHKKPRNWIKIIIGILMAISITIVTICKDRDDKAQLEKDSRVLTTISKKLDIDTLYLHYIDSLGIQRDTINNKPIITNVLIKNITNSIHIDSSNNKLDEKFKELNGSDYIRKGIATEYIINNFPPTLSESQIKALTDANPISASNLSETQNKLCDLLMTQRKSESIEKYFKQVISYNSANAIAWHYFLRKDVNIGVPYIYSVIKDKPNHCITYENIVQYAMEMENVNVCMELLNSHELVDFLISNTDEKDYLKQGYTWISKMIDRKPSYKKYRSTYFFKAVVI